MSFMDTSSVELQCRTEENLSNQTYSFRQETAKTKMIQEVSIVQEDNPTEDDECVDSDIE